MVFVNNDIIKAGNSDVVIIQRKLLQPWESVLLGLRPCKIIFDFDDAILFRSSPPYYSFGRKIKFIPMVRSSNAIVVGNSYLKGLAAKYTNPGKIHILPTPLDLSKYKKKDYTIKSTQITLGWIGSKSTLKYLRRLIPVFNKSFRIVPANSMYACFSSLNSFFSINSIHLVAEDL